MENKPCPFCGSNDLKIENSYVVCNNCFDFSPTIVYNAFGQREIVELLIWESWNKRK